MRIQNEVSWRKKMLQTLECNYARAHNFEQGFALMKELISYETDSLLDFNVNAIKKISNKLKLQCEFRYQSEF